MSVRKKKISDIADSEWDFSERNVPHDKAIDCLVYEYAREFIKNCKPAQTLLREYDLLESEKYSFRAYRDIAEKLHRLLGVKQPFRIPLIPKMKDTPWIDDWRAYQEGERGSKGQLTPVDPEELKNAVAGIVKSFSGERHSAEQNSHKFQGTGISIVGNLTASDGRYFLDFYSSKKAEQIITNRDPQKLEFCFLALDCSVSKTQLQTEFNEWLDQVAEAKKIKFSEMRGGRQMKLIPYDRLRALGAYRLMATGRTVEMCIEYVQGRRADIDETNQELLFNNSSDWSSAKETVRRVMKLLFESSWTEAE